MCFAFVVYRIELYFLFERSRLSYDILLYLYFDTSSEFFGLDFSFKIHNFFLRLLFILWIRNSTTICSLLEEDQEDLLLLLLLPHKEHL